MDHAPDRLLPSLTPDDSHLLKLLLGPSQELPYAGETIRVLLLEFYETGFALTWRLGPTRQVHADEPDERDHYGVRFPRPDFTVTDDQGGVYQSHVRQMSAGRHHLRGRSVYSPAIPADATTLSISVDGQELIVDLTPSESRM